MAGRAPASKRMSTGRSAVMDALPQAGISIDEITARLVEDGVKLFADAADELYAAVQKKRRTVLGSKLNAMSYKLPKELDDGVKAALEDWRKEGKVRRLWAGDASLWTGTDEARWLGWLTIVDEQLKAAGASRCVRGRRASAATSPTRCCSGWAGRASAPRCWPRASAASPASRGCGSSIRPIRRRSAASSNRSTSQRTLFIVSSKSGSTLEPNIFKQYFCERARAASGEAVASQHFVAITDPGSSLEKIAQVEKFRAVCHGARDDRRPLFGAVRFRHGAGRRDRHRHAQLPRSHGRDGAVVRGERAAGREPRRAARRDPRGPPPSKGATS